jgi:hypothetical protein
MDWTSLIGPAVVAAVIASVVSVIGFVINRTTVRGMHSERLVFDREQAERRATAEIALIERKLTADIVLAEKKLAIDQALVTWRRRHELAEQVLATVYEARDALAWARAPLGFSGEGDTREGTESESERLRERRNSYFVPVELWPMTPSFVSTSVKMNGKCLNSPSLATIGRRSGICITRTTTLSSVSPHWGCCLHLLNPPEIKFGWHGSWNASVEPSRYCHLVVYRCESLNLHRRWTSDIPVVRLHDDLYQTGTPIFHRALELGREFLN